MPWQDTYSEETPFMSKIWPDIQWCCFHFCLKMQVWKNSFSHHELTNSYSLFRSQSFVLDYKPFLISLFTLNWQLMAVLFVSSHVPCLADFVVVEAPLEAHASPLVLWSASESKVASTLCQSPLFTLYSATQSLVTHHREYTLLKNYSTHSLLTRILSRRLHTTKWWRWSKATNKLKRIGVKW